MNPEQLALALTGLLEDAAEIPELADLSTLWQQVELVLEQLPVREQLWLGGTIIAHLADLHQVKAEHFLGGWESTFDPQDPTLPSEWLQGFVRQTQHVDISELTAPVQRRPRSKAPKAPSSSGTLVAGVPKANVLKMLEQSGLDGEKANVLAVAHEENVEAAVRAVNTWFKSHPQPISLAQLRQQLGWPLVKLWLSLLLGGFELQATDGQFYSGHILVSNNALK